MQRIIFLYIIKEFAKSFLAWLLIIGLIINLIQFLELTKRAFGKSIGWLEIFSMLFLKTPYLLFSIMPFIIIAATLMTYYKLNQSRELVAMRALQISAWRFTLPSATFIFALGIFISTIFQPYSAILLSKFDEDEARFFKDQTVNFSMAGKGIWLKDSKSYLHANEIYERGRYLSQISLFILDNHHLNKKIFADFGYLEDDKLKLHDVKYFNKNDNQISSAKFLELDTNLNIEQLQESKIPEILYIWKLPDYIEKLDLAGFPSIKHKLFFASLILLPFYYASIIYLVIPFTLINPRSQRRNITIFYGLLIGFALYFIQKVTSAISISEEINHFICALIPIIANFALGCSILLTKEDG